MIGKNHKGALLTVVDRVTGQLRMTILKSKESNEVSLALIKLLSNVGYTINTITTDNGKKFASHLEVSQVLSIDYFFANPYASWERGTNENLNGLIRQYFSKKYNFDLITEEQINYVINKLACNVLQLQEVGDLEAQNYLPALNLIRSTKLHLTTEPPISCRCCYAFGFIISFLFFQ
ncbi:MAG: IS30 family transposase [Bacteroidia bacterium]|nr:IS30 family transposase [Bacteroidia bacterium]